MKKLITVALVAIMLTMAIIMTGCNMNPGLGTYSFKKVHIFIPEAIGGCVEIRSWRDAKVGIEVNTKEYGTLWLSEGTYMLCSDKCPICDDWFYYE